MKSLLNLIKRINIESLSFVVTVLYAIQIAYMLFLNKPYTLKPFTLFLLLILLILQAYNEYLNIKYNKKEK